MNNEALKTHIAIAQDDEARLKSVLDYYAMLRPSPHEPERWQLLAIGETPEAMFDTFTAEDGNLALARMATIREVICYFPLESLATLINHPSFYFDGVGDPPKIWQVKPKAGKSNFRISLSALANLPFTTEFDRPTPPDEDE